MEYIENSDGAAYVQLNFGFDRTDKIETKFSVDSSYTQDKYIVSPQTWNNNSNRFGMGIHNGKRFTAAFGSQQTGTTPLAPTKYNTNGEIYLWTYENNIFSIPALGTSLDVSGISFGGTTANLRLFYGYNSVTKGKIVSYKHWKNGVLKFNGIPAKNSSGAIGFYDTVSRSFITATTGTLTAGPEIGIKIATKAYNDSEFESVQTALTNARTTVSSVVSNTISQSSSIGTLSASKQNRPTTDCPDYRQCMLVQDANNQPTWFPIVDPFYDLFRPMNMQNWTLSHNGSKVDMGYTQLDYIESTGTQYIVLPTFANASNINITTNVLHTDGTNEQILLAPSSGVQYLYTVSTWRTWKSGVNSVSLGAIDKSHVFLIKTTSSGVEYYVDGVKNAGVPANLYTSSAFANKTLNLGSRTLASGGDYFWKGKIYSFKADCNGSICINLIPVQRKSDNAIGMYDTVSGAFFGNSGTGNFTYGATVANTDVPADPIWTVVITGNEEGNTTHVAGTVYGTAKCNSLSATANDVATAANLQSSSWTTAGNNCWCALTQVDTNGNAGIHEKPTWVFNATDSTCSSQCATLCRTSFIGDTTGAFRGALSGIQ